jgi:hypothetical protein
MSDVHHVAMSTPVSIEMLEDASTLDGVVLALWKDIASDLAGRRRYGPHRREVIVVDWRENDDPFRQALCEIIERYKDDYDIEICDWAHLVSHTEWEYVR